MNTTDYILRPVFGHLSCTSWLDFDYSKARPPSPLACATVTLTIYGRPAGAKIFNITEEETCFLIPLRIPLKAFRIGDVKHVSLSG